MEFFIYIDGDNVVGYPLLLDNLKLIDPAFNPEKLPNNILPVKKTEKPVVGIYEVDEGPSYKIVGGEAVEQYIYRKMTTSEKAEKIKNAKLVPKPYPSWVFDESRCNWWAPKPLPDETNPYYWDEESGDWKPFQL